MQPIQTFDSYLPPSPLISSDLRYPSYNSVMLDSLNNPQNYSYRGALEDSPSKMYKFSQSYINAPSPIHSKLQTQGQRSLSANGEKLYKYEHEQQGIAAKNSKPAMNSYLPQRDVHPYTYLDATSSSNTIQSHLAEMQRSSHIFSNNNRLEKSKYDPPLYPNLQAPYKPPIYNNGKYHNPINQTPISSSKSPVGKNMELFGKEQSRSQNGSPYLPLGQYPYLNTERYSQFQPTFNPPYSEKASIYAPSIPTSGYKSVSSPIVPKSTYGVTGTLPSVSTPHSYPGFTGLKSPVCSYAYNPRSSNLSKINGLPNHKQDNKPIDIPRNILNDSPSNKYKPNNLNYEKPGSIAKPFITSSVQKKESSTTAIHNTPSSDNKQHKTLYSDKSATSTEHIQNIQKSFDRILNKTEPAFVSRASLESTAARSSVIQKISLPAVSQTTSVSVTDWSYTTISTAVTTTVNNYSQENSKTVTTSTINTSISIPSPIESTATIFSAAQTEVLELPSPVADNLLPIPVLSQGITSSSKRRSSVRGSSKLLS